MLQSSSTNSIVLASSSPRRVELLTNAGIEFRQLKYPFQEDYPSDLNRHDVPVFLALQKAQQIGKVADSEFLITVDTVVIVDNDILGKPTDRADAINTLKRLSNREHDVVSGVNIRHSERDVSFSETTKVHFSELSNEDIEYYVDTFSPFDKAGSYGIQEWIGIIGISRIEGSFYNVMGLPINRLLAELKKLRSN